VVAIGKNGEKKARRKWERPPGDIEGFLFLFRLLGGKKAIRL